MRCSVYAICTQLTITLCIYIFAQTYIDAKCAQIFGKEKEKKFLSGPQRYPRKLNDRCFCCRGIIFLPATRAGRLYDCRDSIFLSSIVVHFSRTRHSSVPPEVFRPIVDGIPRKIYGSLNWPPNRMLFLLET